MPDEIEKSVSIQTRNQGEKHWFREIVELIILALVIVLPIRLFIVNPFIVSGSSMVPTFHNGEYLIIDQLTYRFNAPERGDVVIFHYPKDTSKFFIKRILGLPGEKVGIRNGIVSIEKAGEKKLTTLIEDYIKNKSTDSGDYVLGDEEYFVMGDNRISSSDSRVWGALDKKYIVGRALLRLLPITEVSLFPGKTEAYSI
ncbi:MAG: signal peptidase I [Candidatus Lloydbacteria bacterium RIFCSPHIGHO2_01_FULL_41_20]|uniref:Signal peptidase I n=1 Tax=Candidatus Lloydbacteria bacterium RIFCSPHIGHO2_01_FULL_41_20 TaxID=1798657 RepID=A0A1G2CRX0_9BACT|nr:MAG: signal peptidase I [Candidatus Lloydbacteria bacterium RIFCSPHIGHO2_01_FULL_41_20]